MVEEVLVKYLEDGELIFSLSNSEQGPITRPLSLNAMTET